MSGTGYRRCWMLGSAALPVLCFAILGTFKGAVSADGPAGEASADSTLAEPSSYLTDPATRRKISEAERLVQEGQPDQVLELLQSVLDSSEDSYSRDAENGWVTSREQAERDAGKLWGPEGIEKYRRHHEDQARTCFGKAGKTRMRASGRR
ncbi:MAG: hypothetical protein U1D30_07375 [Planctomycetota bacterium]